MAKKGRPKSENNMDCVCTIRMDAHTLKRLEAYCEKMMTTKSEIIREAVTELINERSAIDE